MPIFIGIMELWNVGMMGFEYDRYAGWHSSNCKRAKGLVPLKIGGTDSFCFPSSQRKAKNNLNSALSAPLR